MHILSYPYWKICHDQYNTPVHPRHKIISWPCSIRSRNSETCQKHAVVLYNSILNSQTYPISKCFMNLLNLMVMCLAYIYVSNNFFCWFTSRPFILLHSIFPLFVNVSHFPFHPCLKYSYFRIHPHPLLSPITHLNITLPFVLEVLFCSVLKSVVIDSNMYKVAQLSLR